MPVRPASLARGLARAEWRTLNATTHGAPGLPPAEAGGPQRGAGAVRPSSGLRRAPSALGPTLHPGCRSGRGLCAFALGLTSRSVPHSQPASLTSAHRRLAPGLDTHPVGDQCSMNG